MTFVVRLHYPLAHVAHVAAEAGIRDDDPVASHH